MSAPAADARRIRVFLTGAAVLSLTMLLVSGANYLLNFALARMLDPAGFGDATLAITLVLSAAIIAATLQMVAARAAAAQPEIGPALRRSLVRAAIVLGVVCAVLLGGGAWALAAALHTTTPWMFVIIGVGLPVYFAQAVHRGLLQGALRFPRLAATYLAEATVRVGVVLVLVAAGWGVIGASFGILLSFLAAGAVAWTRPVRQRPRAKIPLQALRTTMAGAVVMLMAQTLLNNADLVLAKAAFEPAAAGVYAAAAVLCRSLYFVSWSIVQAVVPVLAGASTTATERRRAGVLAFSVISALGALAILLAATVGGAAVDLLFGREYAAAVPLLVPYTAATALLSLSTLLAATDVARGRRVGPLILMGGALVQVLVLLAAGDTPLSMAWLQVAATALTLAALVIVFVVRAPRLRPTPVLVRAHTETTPIPTAVPARAEQRSS